MLMNLNQNDLLGGLCLDCEQRTLTLGFYMALCKHYHETYDNESKLCPDLIWFTGSVL